MATKKGQRIGILIIAIVMTIGTLGSFAVMVLANKNNSIDQANYQKQMADYQKQAEAQAIANAAASRPLDGYEAISFDKDTVTSLKVETLKQGEGDALKADSTIKANYFGWTSDGNIFDSSNKEGVTTPIEFPLTGVIAGWTEGLTGVKVGSIVKLSIPAEKAYGATGSGASIGPNEPLQFIVEVLELK